METYELITQYENGVPAWAGVRVLASSAEEAQIAAKIMGIPFVDIARLIEVM